MVTHVLGLGGPLIARADRRPQSFAGRGLPQLHHVADEQSSPLTKSDQSSRVSRPPSGDLQFLVRTANINVIRKLRTAVS